VQPAGRGREWLAQADQETTLREAAGFIWHFDNDGLTGWTALERQWIERIVKEPHRSRLLRALEATRR